MTNASCPTTDVHPSAALPVQAPVKAHMRAAMTWMKQVLRVARQRRQLGRLDAHQLQDIGLTCEQARAEALRPFWDLP